MSNSRKWTTDQFDYPARNRGKRRIVAPGAASSAVGTEAYAKMWGIVDGGVADALKKHPDYLTPKGQRSARTSIVKRVTGTVIGFAEQSARSRLRAAETAREDSPLPASLPFSDAGEGDSASSPSIHRVRIGKVTLKRQVSSRRSLPFNETLNMLRRAALTQGAGPK
jgi:hypothetical protein